MSGSYRCSLCGISYPDSKPCRVCGSRTDGISDPHDEDWQEKVALAIAASPSFDEYQRLVAYRTTSLLDLGFSIEQIEQLPLHRPDIAHAAEKLLGRRAPHDYVVLELKED